MFLQQNPIDPTLPQSYDIDQVSAWPLDVTDLLDGLFEPGTAPLLGMGNNLWTGLASIVVVWTGLRIAFSGASFRPWELVTLIIGLSIPLGMLRFYTVDVPGAGLPFPFIIPAGADAIAAAFQGDMAIEQEQAMARMNEAMRQNMEAAKAGEDLPGIRQLGALIIAVAQNVLASLNSMLFGLIFTTAFLVVAAVCYAQVLWAQIAISILIYLGPVMIPWLVWKPMSFLFWGWFKALWTYSLYSIIASAVLRVFAALSVSVIESVNASIVTGMDPVSGPETGPFLLAIIPLLVAALMAALKVPELASAIVGSGGGGGIAGAAAMAMTGGKAKLAKMAAGGK